MELEREFLGLPGLIIIRLDRRGRIRLINSFGTQVLGRSLENLMGKSWFEAALPRRIRRKVRESYKSLMKGDIKDFEYHELPLLSADGEEHLIHWHNRLLKGEKGGIEGILSVGEDITVDRRRERELVLLQTISNMLNAGYGKEEVFQTMVEGIRNIYDYDSVAIHLLSADKKFLVLENYSAESRAARALEKLIKGRLKGYPIPLFEGSILTKVIEERRPVITSEIEWILKSYTDRSALQRLAAKARGLTKARWGIGVPLLAGESVIGIIGCGSVRELKSEDAKRLGLFGAQAGLAFERMRNLHRLERSNNLKDTFIDIMRHDLLNPAGVIKGIAEMAIEDEGTPKEECNMILKNITLIIRMIEDSALFAKMESDETLRVEETDLLEVVNRVVEDNESGAAEKNMTLGVSTNKKTFIANVNPMMYDVIGNLVNNAIKYGNPGTHINVDVSKRAGKVDISISNRGPNIPDENKKGIFERFQRLSKGSIKGSGLGLAIVKRVTEAHGGRAWVEDNPHGGCIFNVEVPSD